MSEPQDPPSIDPYEILGVGEKATPDEIKTAYRKKALRHHPDKATPESKDEANQKFQEIAFAYAILSDERRRRRYDLTGSTEEVLGLEDDDFDWMDFYREQFSSMVDTGAIDKIKHEYQHSEEETTDLLAAYEQFHGDMDRIYDSVLLSSVLDDDERFRAIIDQAIAEGRVKGWKKYTEESEKKKQQRLKRAREEAKEAEEAAKELDDQGKRKKKNASKKQSAQSNMNDLAALIQQRQKSRGANFLDQLEAKYSRPGKKRRADLDGEPPEEAFEAVAARKSKKKSKA
ncbi:hypothetical protein ASPZODRAFT_65086 [Penicilliopsis zonata CBS 506.65]|uniref:J domain-containing protein n=1 Tax=Penicilliopsis zonata CBS 506.65 TaxID=1073090 RepID=A0A1L9SJ00_9EURO|nr:hypothetical protein ASPZODRAFT_65086 [Penicilliopsis zonata CBS 506.65]OJJ47199.1 hypothetical protein ASPZODRAFT_65086 [Penicilliopsis zonata CBS 506.65]